MFSKTTKTQMKLQLTSAQKAMQDDVRGQPEEVTLSCNLKVGGLAMRRAEEQLALVSKESDSVTEKAHEAKAGKGMMFQEVSRARSHRSCRPFGESGIFSYTLKKHKPLMGLKQQFKFIWSVCLI